MSKRSDPLSRRYCRCLTRPALGTVSGQVSGADRGPLLVNWRRHARYQEDLSINASARGCDVAERLCLLVACLHALVGTGRGHHGFQLCLQVGHAIVATGGWCATLNVVQHTAQRSASRPTQKSRVDYRNVAYVTPHLLVVLRL